VTSWALRHGGPETGDADNFPTHVDNLIAMMEPAGVGLAVQGRTYELRATPQAVDRPEVWLLGSSDYSAQLAAAKGLPYVFAHHFSGQGTARALELYRSSFRPSDFGDRPTTFLTANVVVADSAAEAERLVRPNLLSMIALRTGGNLAAQVSVEAAERTEIPAAHRALADEMRSRWFLGTPEQATAQLEQLAEQYGVDEIMLSPIAGSSEADPLDRSPAREATLTALAATSRVAA
jgi:luciferase family oxidoreductase group 1